MDINAEMIDENLPSSALQCGACKLAGTESDGEEIMV
jgi:hypothetical protein